MDNNEQDLQDGEVGNHLSPFFAFRGLVFRP